MSTLITKQNLIEEFNIALKKIRECDSNDFIHSVNPISIPITDTGITCSINCNDPSGVFDGDVSIQISVIVPRSLIDTDDIEQFSYMEEIIQSDGANLIKSAINEKFGVNKNLMIRDSTKSTIIFRTTISLDDPTLFPTEENEEIIPVIEMDIKTKWIPVRETEMRVKERESKEKVAISKSNGDITLLPDKDHIKRSNNLQFGDTVTIFGTEYTIELKDKDIVLTKQENVVAYIDNISDKNITDFLTKAE